MSSKSIKIQQYTPGFLAFWSVYPKKVGKIDAHKKWHQRGLERERGRMVSSVDAHMKRDEQWKKDGGRFIPHPATYISQGRDLDEFDTAGKQPDMVSIPQPNGVVVRLERQEYERMRSRSADVVDGDGNVLRETRVKQIGAST